MRRSVASATESVGYVRPRELRALAVEMHMELLGALDLENERDLKIMRECRARIEERMRHKKRIRDDSARLERMQVA